MEFVDPGHDSEGVVLRSRKQNLEEGGRGVEIYGQGPRGAAGAGRFSRIQILNHNYEKHILQDIPIITFVEI